MTLPLYSEPKVKARNVSLQCSGVNGVSGHQFLFPLLLNSAAALTAGGSKGLKDQDLETGNPESYTTPALLFAMIYCTSLKTSSATPTRISFVED